MPDRGVAVLSRDPELALLEPNTEILTCPVCGELVWKHRTHPITARMSLPSHPWPVESAGQALQYMMEAANETYRQTVTIPAEEASRAHMEKRHPIRLWIWDHFGWDRVLRKWLV